MAVGPDAMGEKLRKQNAERLAAIEARIDDFITSRDESESAFIVPMPNVERFEWAQLMPKYQQAGWTFDDDWSKSFSNVRFWPKPKSTEV